MPPSLPPSETFLNLLVTCSLKGTMFLLLVGILALFTSSASRRHFIWVCGFAFLGALLIFEPFVPHWGILPDWQTSGWLETIRPWIFPIWTVGALLFCAKVLLGLVALYRIERHSTQLTQEPWDSILDECRRDLGIRRRVRLLKFPGRIMPMTWGVLRNVVVLPSTADRWSGQRIRAVLMHELAHVRRGDYLASLLRDAVCAFYWFHPLIWWAAREMDEDREEASDDAVIAAGERPVVYAEHLTTVATRGWGPKMVDPQVRPKVALAEKPLIVRVRSILAPWKSRHPITWSQRLQTGAALGLVLTVVLIVGPGKTKVESTLLVTGASGTPIKVEADLASGSQALPGSSGLENLLTELPTDEAQAVPGWQPQTQDWDRQPSTDDATSENKHVTVSPGLEIASADRSSAGEGESDSNVLQPLEDRHASSPGKQALAALRKEAEVGAVLAPSTEYSTSPPEESEEGPETIDIREFMASFENAGDVSLDEFDLGNLIGESADIDFGDFEFLGSGSPGSDFSIASLTSSKVTEKTKAQPTAKASVVVDKSRTPAENQRDTTTKAPIPPLPTAAQDKPPHAEVVTAVSFLQSKTRENHLFISFPWSNNVSYLVQASPDLSPGSWSDDRELFGRLNPYLVRGRVTAGIILNEPISKSSFRFLRVRVTPKNAEKEDDGTKG